ncbi:MAG: hypothetical protein HEQ39_09670 [Rhizobacter sp.]
MATLYGGQLSGAGSTHYGGAGFGVPGATVPATGTHGPAAAYEFLALPAQNNVEVQWLMQTYPAAGVFDMGNDTGFTLAGAPDGGYSFTGILKFDGVSQGLKSHTITIGAPVINLTSASSMQTNASPGAAITQVLQLLGSACVQTNNSSTEAISVPPAGVINLFGAPCTQANTSGVGALTQIHQLVGSTSVQTNNSGTGAVVVSGSNGGTGATSAEIVAAMMSALSPDLLRLLELHKLHGLDVMAPLQVTGTSRVAGNIYQLIQGTDQATTVVRQ